MYERLDLHKRLEPEAESGGAFPYVIGLGNQYTRMGNID